MIVETKSRLDDESFKILLNLSESNLGNRVGPLYRKGIAEVLYHNHKLFTENRINEEKLISTN